MNNDSLCPIFDRITSSLFCFFQNGLTPPCMASDPVIWHRREHNRIADFIVNCTMELGQSWLKEVPPAIPDFSPCEANFICHSDGGTRTHSCSASGWVLEAIVTRAGYKCTFPVAFRGVYFQQPVSSFTAEAVALDDAIQYLSRVCSNQLSAKRARTS